MLQHGLEKLDELADTIDELITTVDELTDELPPDIQPDTFEALRKTLSRAGKLADKVEQRVASWL